MIINSSVWIYGMNKESKSPPRFYPYSFELRAKHLLSQSLGIEQHNITAKNCVNVYKYLIVKSNNVSKVAISLNSVKPLIQHAQNLYQ